MSDAGHYGLHSKNAGSDYRPDGCPKPVKVHDFMIQELGRAVPYGVYDLAANAGWISVGVNNDTAAFAVETVRRWGMASAASTIRTPSTC